MPTAVSPGPQHPKPPGRVSVARPPHADEAYLMRRVVAHDCQAFEALYTRYAPRLAGFLGRRLRSPELVDEVLNEVMLTLWLQAARFDPSQRLSTWLLGIARNRASTAFRRDARHSDVLLPATADGKDGEDPEVSITRQERARAVSRALQRLPPEQRLVVEWTYYQGYSASEIAARTGDPLPTVKSRLRLAHGRLAHLLFPSPREREAPAETRRKQRGRGKDA